MKDILVDIIQNKRAETEYLKARVSIDELYRNVVEHSIVSFRESLETSESGIISEFKRRSPSKGWIHRNADPADIVIGYEANGAAAMSILTDEKYFGGTLDDVRSVRSSVGIPILRKDFVIDEYQLHEARAAGADVILLIAAVLTERQCGELAAIAREIGLETLLEIHSEQELSYINDNIDVVGVNNRNLGTFVTDVETSVTLAPKLPSTLTRISESGLKDADTIYMLHKLGFRGFLIGEQLMKGKHPAQELAKLTNELKRLKRQTDLQ